MKIVGKEGFCAHGGTSVEWRSTGRTALVVLGQIEGKRTLLGTPDREPQEYSRDIIGIYLPGSFNSIIFLLYSWGSLFAVPSKVPLEGGRVGNPLSVLVAGLGFRV